jgi:translocation and assembly module TamB
VSTTPNTLFGRRSMTSGGSPSPRGHRWLQLFVIVVVVLAVVIAGLSWYASTPQFANKVRNKLITVLEDSTGGRVELGAFRWRVLHLEFEADNLTIHGLEGPGEIPYAHLDKLLVRVKIISLFRAKIGLNYLEIDKPVVHLIVNKDGSTNQPVPKKKSAPLEINQTINQVFDLAVDRAEINNGRAIFNQRAIPFALAANDLQVGVNYVPKSDQYDASLSIADITANRGIAAPIHSSLSMTAVMGRNTLSVPQLHFTAGASTLAAHVSLSNFADPHWQLSAKGTIDLREAEALAAIPGIDRGVVSLDLRGQGTKALFSVEGPVRLASATYRTSSVNLGGLNVATTLHMTQDLLNLQDIRASLASGGSLTGDLTLDQWLAPSAPQTPVADKNASVLPSSAQKGAATARAAHAVQTAVAASTSNPQAKAGVSHGTVHAQLHGFSLESILKIIAPPKFQHLGFATVANGNVDLNWSGDASDLAAQAQVALRAPASVPQNNVPLNGTIRVDYVGRSSSVIVHQLALQTPGTQLTATGGVGLASGTHATLQTQLTVSNLVEFNTAFASLGLGKPGSAALPVSLHGQASFQGVVSGNLASPDVRGHLAVNNFDLLLNEMQAASGAKPSTAQVVNAAVPSGAPSSAPQTFHIDSLTADAEYSPSLVSVQSAVVTHGTTQVQLSGQLHPERTRHGYTFGKASSLQATAAINDAKLAELLALAGQSSLPVSGTLNLQANVGGTLGNLKGGGHLQIDGGQLYGEPYKSLAAQLSFAGQDVGASQLILQIAGGQINGSGSYNLTTNRFHAEAQTSGIALDKLQALKQSPLLVRGQFAFHAQGSGTIAEPQVQAEAHLSRLVLTNPAGGPASTGQIDLTAHTQAGSLVANMQARLNGALATLDAQTSLKPDYGTKAKLTLSNLDINPFLQLFEVAGVQGKSVLSGTVTVSGPLATPKALQGDAVLSKISIESQGISLGTDGPLHATLDNGFAQLFPVHITGGGTDFHAQGGAELFGTARRLDAKADGTLDLKVAHTFDPDINSSGTVSLNFAAGNTIEKPDLEGSVDFHDVDLAYGDFPNGINHLNGALKFDQGRLTVNDLKATSGGGDLVFGGFITYQQGIYADLSINANQVRVRYPAGISTTFNSKLRIQGTLKNALVSGGVVLTRLSISSGLDASSLSSNGISPPPDPTAFGNRIRLDVHVTSAPQLDVNNSYAKIAGDADLHVRGTAVDPSVLGNISITEGDATFAGTHYVLQHGDIYFTNPVKIDPTIDIEASAHVEDYDVIIGLHGTPEKLVPTFRSEPPLSEQDVFSLLALGRTQEEQAIYSEQQSQAGVNSTADSLLGGALNATVSSRINKLFGGGSVKIDPTFVSGSGNSTARITVQQQVSKNGTVTYATNVNSTAQQLIQGQYNLTQNISVLAVRDESGVFSLEVKLHQRYR